VTAMNEDFIKENYKDFGIRAIISKPVNGKRIKQVLQEILK
jgi:hypothetical protein